MEVSGKRQAESDDTNTRLLCDPCESAGDTENADNYCVDCHEFLCLHCAKAHKRQTLSKDHQLLERAEMPKSKMNISSNTCRKHDGKSFDFFCKNHNVLCCSVCLTLDHRQCAAEYITDLVERFDRSGEYEALRTKMRNLDGLIGEIKTRTDSNIAASKRLADQLVSDIKKFRAEINAYLDSLEKQILEKVDKVKTEGIQDMSAIAEELDTMKTELDAMTVKMEGLSELNRKKDLVISSKLSNTLIDKIDNRVCKLTKQNTLRQFQFCRNNQILDMLQSSGIGTLEEKKQPNRGLLVIKKKTDKTAKSPQSYNIKHQIDINIKHKEDNKDCMVTGSVMMDTGRLAIADSNNDSVKVVDTYQGTILSYTRLSSNPWDITYTDQNQLVVTAPDIQTLIFLDVGKTLTVNKELKVDGKCHGIDYTDNKLIVSFINPSSVKILNMDGHVLSSISNDPNGKPLFSCPYYVISNADSSAIYVSNWGQSTVTKLDMTGRVTYKYTSNDYKYPYGIVVDQYDNLYIAGSTSSTVCILSAEGRQINTIKFDRPQSVALCEDTHQLFVSHGYGSSSSNSLSVYKLH